MKNYYVLIIATFCCIYSLKSQTVSTISSGNLTDGLAQDQLGNLFCSDWGGNIVYKIDSNDSVSIFKGGFSNPNGIAVDDTNNIYICDHTANRIKKYNQSGTQLRTFNGFNSPAGIKRMPNSPNFIVVEYNFGRIKVLEPNGTVTQLHQGTPLSGPAGIAIIDTNIYIANFNNRNIYHFTGGTLNFVAQLPSHPFPGSFDNLGFLTALNGKLYATHISGNRIYEIDPVSGIASVFAGSIRGFQDGALSTATFNQPNGILADPINNRMYISEAGGLKNLRIIDNFVVSTQKNQFEKLNINIYPNPAKNELNVNFSGIQSHLAEFTIFNQLGQILLTKQAKLYGDALKINLDESLFPTGHYAINVKINDQIQSLSFIVE